MNVWVYDKLKLPDVVHVVGGQAGIEYPDVYQVCRYCNPQSVGKISLEFAGQGMGETDAPCT